MHGGGNAMLQHTKMKRADQRNSESLHLLYLQLVSFNKNSWQKLEHLKFLKAFNITNRDIIVVGYFIDGHAKVRIYRVPKPR